MTIILLIIYMHNITNDNNNTDEKHNTTIYIRIIYIYIYILYTYIQYTYIQYHKAGNGAAKDEEARGGGEQRQYVLAHTLQLLGHMWVRGMTVVPNPHNKTGSAPHLVPHRYHC